MWTLDLRVLDPDGFEYYRWNGYLPPSEFVPQLLVGEAQARLRSHDETGAAELYAEVIRRFPTSYVAAEAQYFLAVSKYKASHEANDLMDGWRKVQLHYPSNIGASSSPSLKRADARRSRCRRAQRPMVAASRRRVGEVARPARVDESWPTGP